MKPNAPLQLLGGLSPAEFLSQYWQRKPLLVRGAITDFSGCFSRQELLQLACRDEVESRLVRQDGQQWSLSHGPFKPAQLRGKDAWTVLVSGCNLVSKDADALLRRFAFVPYSRLDDLMVSYASDGGGVGPHFDNYDVFLIQGIGKRRWRIGAQKDLRLVEGAPLRILKAFKPSQEWVLEPGDMLYLPPQWAHDGIAQGECMTYSVGFRAPTAQELGEAFLSHLQDKLALPGRFTDPALQVTRKPGELPAASIAQVAEMLRKIRWNERDVREFLGSYLSEPKSHVFFEPPEQAMSFARFRAACRRYGFELDLKTQLLFSGKQAFLNGEVLALNDHREAAPYLRALANQRALPAGEYPENCMEVLYEWYCDGFARPGEAQPT